MDAVKILQALAALDAILAATQQAVAKFNATVATARAEQRDLTDGELDALHAETQSALDAFKRKAGL